MSIVLTVAEVAEQLRVHPMTVRRMIKAGDLPAFKVGRDWRVRQDVVEALTEGEAVS